MVRFQKGLIFQFLLLWKLLIIHFKYISDICPLSYLCIVMNLSVKNGLCAGGVHKTKGFMHSFPEGMVMCNMNFTTTKISDHASIRKSRFMSLKTCLGNLNSQVGSFSIKVLFQAY